MSDISRRNLLQLAGGVALGIGAFGRRPHWPGVYGGVLEAQNVSNPPVEVTDDVDDERFADVDPIQEVTQRAAIAGGSVSVSRREYRPVAAALEELPYYDPDPREEDVDPVDVARIGAYVADGEETYRLTLTPYCGRLFDARSGEFTRGTTCTER